MRKFIELWITLLREAMAKTGNGQDWQRLQASFFAQHWQR